jgi:hypothetical protein
MKKILIILKKLVKDNQRFAMEIEKIITSNGERCQFDKIKERKLLIYLERNLPEAHEINQEMHFLYCEDQDSVSTKLKKKQG